MKNRTTCIEETLLSNPSVNDEKVRIFQRKLYIRAKRERSFKAYSLYDKVSDDYVLIEAYRRVKSNYSQGVGVDGQSFEDIERIGLTTYLSSIQDSLGTRTYRSNAVREVRIPKEKKGEYRTLGIPTIRDRIVQMAVKMLIEPLWEADFIDTSYGFRPKRGAKEAIKQIKSNIYEGYHFVYDADLSQYFDSIPHGRLFRLLKERISDHGILELIGHWLRAPVLQSNGELRANRIGSPQGGVISPLLSNIYLHALDRIVTNPEGKFAKSGIRIVRYADDFVLMGKWYFSRSILSYLHLIMDNMGLALNKEKTKLLHTGRSSLYFLGFEFRKIRSRFGWNPKSYTDVRPSMKSRSKLFSRLRELLSKRRHWGLEWITWKLNQLLRGWLNYFSISKVTHIWDTISVIREHLNYKLFKWMKSKGRKAHKVLGQHPYRNMVKYYGLIDLGKYARLKTLLKAE